LAPPASPLAANSLQTSPPEPGINHFNSDPDSSVWTFAAQAKAGVRVGLGPHAYVFGEYRYLYVGSNDQNVREHRVCHPCAHDGLDGSLRRCVLSSGKRRPRVQFLAQVVDLPPGHGISAVGWRRAAVPAAARLGMGRSIR